MKRMANHTHLKILKPLVLVCSLCMLSMVSAKVYKWTDDQGTTHYTSTPPQNKTAKNMERDLRLSLGSKSSNASRKQVTEDEEESEEDKDDKGEEKTADSSQFEKVCKQKQSQLDVMQNNEQIRWNENGKSRLLTAEEKSKKMKTIKEEVDKFCAEV